MTTRVSPRRSVPPRVVPCAWRTAAPSMPPCRNLGGVHMYYVGARRLRPAVHHLCAHRAAEPDVRSRADVQPVGYGRLGVFRCVANDAKYLSVHACFVCEYKLSL